MMRRTKGPGQGRQEPIMQDRPESGGSGELEGREDSNESPLPWLG